MESNRSSTVSKGAFALSDLTAQAFDGLVRKVDMRQDLGHQEALVRLAVPDPREVPVLPQTAHCRTCRP